MLTINRFADSCLCTRQQILLLLLCIFLSGILTHCCILESKHRLFSLTAPRGTGPVSHIYCSQNDFFLIDVQQLSWAKFTLTQFRLSGHWCNDKNRPASRYGTLPCDWIRIFELILKHVGNKLQRWESKRERVNNKNEHLLWTLISPGVCAKGSRIRLVAVAMLMSMTFLLLSVAFIHCLFCCFLSVQSFSPSSSL